MSISTVLLLIKKYQNRHLPKPPTVANQAGNYNTQEKNENIATLTEALLSSILICLLVIPIILSDLQVIQANGITFLINALAIYVVPSLIIPLMFFGFKKNVVKTIRDIF
jgi:hypothetical protein